MVNQTLVEYQCLVPVGAKKAFTLFVARNNFRSMLEAKGHAGTFLYKLAFPQELYEYVDTILKAFGCEQLEKLSGEDK